MMGLMSSESTFPDPVFFCSRNESLLKPFRQGGNSAFHRTAPGVRRPNCKPLETRPNGKGPFPKKEMGPINRNGGYLLSHKLYMYYHRQCSV